MLITLNDLKLWKRIDKVVIHSLYPSLYQASVFDGDTEYYVAASDGNLLRGFNVLSMQGLFANLPVNQMVLQQYSAYDEMVGQPIRVKSNVLEVPLSIAAVSFTPDQYGH